MIRPAFSQRTGALQARIGHSVLGVVEDKACIVGAEVLQECQKQAPKRKVANEASACLKLPPHGDEEALASNYF